MYCTCDYAFGNKVLYSNGDRENVYFFFNCICVLYFCHFQFICIFKYKKKSTLCVDIMYTDTHPVLVDFRADA